MGENLLFLSPDWVHEVTRVVQSARSTDENFRKLAESFSVVLLYQVSDLPLKLAEIHCGSSLAILVQLDKGTVRKLLLGADPSCNKSDFTVSSNYSVVKNIFCGDINPAVAYIDHQIKVEPLRRVYARPRFTAKAIVTANAILKIARRIPTVFPQEC